MGAVGAAAADADTEGMTVAVGAGDAVGVVEAAGSDGDGVAAHAATRNTIGMSEIGRFIANLLAGFSYSRRTGARMLTGNERPLSRHGGVAASCDARCC